MQQKIDSADPIPLHGFSDNSIIISGYRHFSLLCYYVILCCRGNLHGSEGPGAMVTTYVIWNLERRHGSK